MVGHPVLPHPDLYKQYLLDSVGHLQKNKNAGYQGGSWKWKEQHGVELI